MRSSAPTRAPDTFASPVSPSPRATISAASFASVRAAAISKYRRPTGPSPSLRERASNIMQDNVVGALAIVCIFGGPVAAWMVMRILKHKERMEMLRRGMMPPLEFTDKNAYKAWRSAGSPWPPPGAAPQAPWTPPPATATWTSPEDDPQRALYKGIRLALIGFAITAGLGIAFHGFSGNPIILRGLIPMFVGIAQIIIAVLSGAQLPGVDPRITF